MIRKPRLVEPGDVPHESAARRLGISLVQFNALRERLEARGFPPPDETTGLYDLDAIDMWRKLRNPHLFGLTPMSTAPEADCGLIEKAFASRAAAAARNKRPGKR